MRRKNGFTLIELLAVILILGIIALIAIPTVNNIINESRKGAFKSTVENLLSAIEQQCQLEQMKGQTITKLYVFDENGVTPSLSNVKGSLPTSGSIALNDNCEIVASLSNDDITISKNLKDDTKIEEGNTANSNMIVPLNPNTSKLFFFAAEGSMTSHDTQNPQITIDFSTKVTRVGIVAYLNSSDELIGFFVIMGIPNEEPDQAVDYMENLIDAFKQKYGNEIPEIPYYITPEYCYLMVGYSDFSEITSETLDGLTLEEYVKEANESYNKLKDTPPSGDSDEYTLFVIEY